MQTDVGLAQAAVIAPPGLSIPEQNAITMLIKEVEERTPIRWPCRELLRKEANPVIAVGQVAPLAAFVDHQVEGGGPAERKGEHRVSIHFQ